ncbi:hypothetical protein J2T61_001953 [Methanocalculus sp. AMF5]|nr:hypothetical protein [Methanocalculus sp. AMF5]
MGSAGRVNYRYSASEGETVQPHECKSADIFPAGRKAPLGDRKAALTGDQKEDSSAPLKAAVNKELFGYVPYKRIGRCFAYRIKSRSEV